MTAVYTCQPNTNIGDGGPATQAILHEPEGVTVDAAGNLYIADTYSLVANLVVTDNAAGYPRPWH